MDRKTFKQICRDRTLCWGTVMWEHMEPQIVRTLARAGFDWIWVDNEHSYHSNDKLYQVIRTAEDLGVITLLSASAKPSTRSSPPRWTWRPAALSFRVSRRRTRCAAWFRPPSFRRSANADSAFDRPCSAKNAMSMKERIEDMNENRLLVVQLETPKAIDDIEAHR